MAQVRSSFRSERGAELIEFAVVMPILIFIIAGIFEFGMMFRALEAITNAAREGARVGVLPGYDVPDVQTRVNDYLNASGLTGAHTTTVTNQTLATGAGTFTARSVNVSYPYTFVVLSGFAPMVGGGTFGSINLTAASIMRTETQATP
jgi:Flp pilus assembly protein TadG